MKCLKCKFQNPEGTNFCGACGTHLQEHQNETKSERKYVTIIFTDLSGYTKMTEILDPEDVRSVLESVFKKIARIIMDFDGFIERYIGDSVMAVFGIPNTHEDDPVRAILASMQIHAAVNRMNEWIRQRTGCAVCMHTGINTGLVLTGKVNRENGSHGLTGLDLNIAARLEGIARDDEIIVGLSTYELTRHLFEFEEYKPVKVKGRSELLRIFKVLSKKPIAPVSREPCLTEPVFVGREEQMQQLLTALNNLVKKGTGQVIAITGEPGIGKSRIVLEYKKHCQDLDLLWISSQSSIFGQKTGYGTFLDLLKNFAGIRETDDDVKSWEKLEARLHQLMPEELANTLPYLATLLSIQVQRGLDHKVEFLDAEALKSQIFRAFYLLVNTLIKKRPLVLEFEDFHWTDESTVALLIHLLPLIEQAPLLFIFVSRQTKESPIYHLKNMFNETFSRCYLHIALQPLSKKNVLDFTRQQLNHESVSSQLIGLIHRKSEGNPLYMEELLRTLISQDLLEKNPVTGQYTLKPVSGKIQIPDTLRGLVTSSVDKLDKQIVEVLKKASIIGRSFFYRLLKSIENQSDVLDSHLSVLINENLIKEKTANPELEYYFYHDLIKDAVYDTILLKERKELHKKVAEAIETLFKDQIEKFYSLLSYHFAKASEWNSARRYFALAGDQANKIAGDSEALAHYKKALSAHEEIFGDQINDFDKAVYSRKLGEIYFRRGEHDKALEAFKKAFSLLGIAYPFTRWKTRAVILRQVCRQCFHRMAFFFYKNQAVSTKSSDFDREIARIFESMAWIDLFINQERMALDIIFALNFAEKIHNTDKMIQTYAGLGFLLDTLGLFSIAGYYLNLSDRFITPDTEDHTLAYANLCMAAHLDYTGHWDQAMILYKKAAALFENIGHIKKWGSPVSLMVFIHNHRGEFEKIREYAQELEKIGVESGDRQLQGWGLGAKAILEIRTGKFEEAARDLEQSRILLESIPDYYALIANHVDLMVSYLHMGNYTRAHEAIKIAENIIRKKHLKGFILSIFFNGACEFFLTVFERSIQIEKKVTLRKIKKYADRAMRHGHRFKCGLPKACRLNGWYYSLAGKPRKAEKFWQQSISVAQNLGANFEEGLTCFEMGRFLNDITHLQKAKAIFQTIHAKAELSRLELQIKRIERQVSSD